MRSRGCTDLGCALKPWIGEDRRPEPGGNRGADHRARRSHVDGNQDERVRVGGAAEHSGGSCYGKQQGKDVVAPTDDPSDIESFYLPSYTLLAANISYDWRQMRFALIFDSLLDEEYYSGSFDEYSVLPGAPRSVRFSVGWSL